MRLYQGVIKGAAGDPLPHAVRMGRALARDGGHSSYDCIFIGYRGADGRPTLTPTDEALFTLRFWKSDRRGKYRTTDVPARPICWSDLRRAEA